MLRQQVSQLLSQGLWSEAEAVCDDAIAQGGEPEAYHFKAVVRTQAGRYSEAFPLYEEARLRMPQNPDVLYNFGSACQQSGDLQQALELWRLTIILKPGDTRALFNIAAALKHLDRNVEAEAAYRTLLSLDPLHGYALLDLGGLVYQNRDLASAIEIFTRAVQVMPLEKEAWLNLGTSLKASGDPASAEPCLRQALNIDPDYRPAHIGLAKLLLQQGRWSEGFAELEWRHRSTLAPFPEVAEWNGAAPLLGQRLLVWTENNLAECIQLARYLDLLRTRAPAAVTVICPAPLCELISRMPGVTQTWPHGAPLDGAEFDSKLPLSGIPRLLGLEDPAALPAAAYIRNPAAPQSSAPQSSASQNSASQNSADGRLRIGLAWSVDPLLEQPHEGDCTLTTLLPLVELSDTIYTSLQVNPATKDAERLANEPRLRDCAAKLADYGGVAASLREIDLLVATDSAIAHLAAAMGVPVCVLLPFAAGWQWGPAAAETPWYASARLYRQPAPGDWRSAVAALRDDIAARRLPAAVV